MTKVARSFSHWSYLIAGSTDLPARTAFCSGTQKRLLGASMMASRILRK